MFKSYLPLILILICACQPKKSEIFDFPVIAYMKLDETWLEISEITSDLEVPWDIDTNQENNLWITEISGSVHLLDLITGERKQVYQVPDVLAKKSYGLLGMTVHPEKRFVFLHYTFAQNNEGHDEKVFSRLVRYTYDGEKLIQPKVLLDNLPGATYHNGSRIVISPKNKLFFSLGDVGRTDLVYIDTFAGGKVHRLNMDGSIPEDNPLPGSTVWAKGFRNTQGLTFGSEGMLYGSDHGPITDDEINLIKKGGDYGWPEIHGFIDQEKEKLYSSEHTTIEPLMAWTPTIAAAGLAFFHDDKIPEWKNSLLLATLKGRSLRVLHLNETGTKLQSEDIFLQKDFGRLRDVSVASNGDIYLSTSNRDWHPRFQPWMYDGLPEGPDRILRISKMDKNKTPISGLPVYQKEDSPLSLMDENWTFEVNQELDAGAKLYRTHCLVCHGPDGKGSDDLIPPLKDTDWVTGDKGWLIRLMLSGLSGPILVNGKTYNQEMPAFDYLSDKEIADLLTFIRNHFGNNASAVIPGEVFEERKGL